MMWEELRYRRAFGHLFRSCWSIHTWARWPPTMEHQMPGGQAVGEASIRKASHILLMLTPFVNLGHGHIMGGRHGHSLQELEHWRGLDLGREVLHMAVSLRTGRRVCLVMPVSVYKEAPSNYSPKDRISWENDITCQQISVFLGLHHINETFWYILP